MTDLVPVRDSKALLAPASAFTQGRLGRVRRRAQERHSTDRLTQPLASPVRNGRSVGPFGLFPEPPRNNAGVSMNRPARPRPAAPRSNTARSNSSRALSSFRSASSRFRWVPGEAGPDPDVPDGPATAGGGGWPPIPQRQAPVRGTWWPVGG
ncbi:hypothetical protein G3I71_19255 [Streptomyces sp. SID12501]|uniref:Uncharacterized protein n=1 Tax=Streptomyces sp. SID12501 TaxID=2706042 RepID=A0A6B3BU63_9ACTN|nr:hypothetical protein [Streptomyces sp. SID12501]